jgi:hypothetical protein
MRGDPFASNLEWLTGHNRWSLRSGVGHDRTLLNVDISARRVPIDTVKRRTSTTYRKHRR